MHCFELRTANLVYYVGEDPNHGLKGDSPRILPPPESGIGVQLAKGWERALRQALMPVPTPSSVNQSSSQSECVVSYFWSSSLPEDISR